MEPVEFKGILSPEQLDREIFKFWKACIIAAAMIPVLSVLIILAVVLGYTKLSTISAIAYPVTAIVLITFGLGFIIPATITSIRRVSMTVRMAYTGLHTNERVANDLRALIKEAKPIIETVKNQTQDGFLEKIEGHLKTIADRVKKATDPLQPKKRTLIED